MDTTLIRKVYVEHRLDLLDPRLLQKRINRVLSKDKKYLRKIRADKGSNLDFLRYYIIDTSTGEVLKPDVNIEELGRNIGVLKDNEELDKENNILVMQFRRIMRRFYYLALEREKLDAATQSKADI